MAGDCLVCLALWLRFGCSCCVLDWIVWLCFICFPMMLVAVYVLIVLVMLRCWWGLYDLWLYFLVLIGPAGLCICSRCRCL